MAIDAANFTSTPEGYATPEQLAQAKEYAALLQRSSNSPVRHPMEGVANVVRALMGGLGAQSANQMQNDTTLQKADDQLQAMPVNAAPAEAAPSAVAPAASQPNSPKPLSAAMTPYAAKLIGYESGWDPNATTGSYRGYGQWSVAERKRHGITDENMGDIGVNVAALERDKAERAPVLSKTLGRTPTDAEFYLAHQQGLGGAMAHFSNPDQPAWINMLNTEEGRRKGPVWAKEAIWGNIPTRPRDSPAFNKAMFPGGVESVKSGDFTGGWNRKWEGGRRSDAGEGQVLSDAAPIGGEGSQLAMADIPPQWPTPSQNAPASPAAAVNKPADPTTGVPPGFPDSIAHSPPPAAASGPAAGPAQAAPVTTPQATGPDPARPMAGDASSTAAVNFNQTADRYNTIPPGFRPQETPPQAQQTEPQEAPQAPPQQAQPQAAPRPPFDRSVLYPPIDRQTALNILTYGDPDTQKRLLERYKPQIITDNNQNQWAYFPDRDPQLVKPGLGTPGVLKMDKIEIPYHMRADPNGQARVVFPQFGEAGQPPQSPSSQYMSPSLSNVRSPTDLVRYNNELEAEKEAGKERMASLSKMRSSFSDKLDHNREALLLINSMQSAINQSKGGISFGPMADVALKGKELWTQITGQEPPGTRDARAVNKIATQLASHLAKDLTNRPTQFDFKTFLENTPGIGMTESATRYMLGIMRQQYEQKIALGHLAMSPEASDARLWPGMLKGFYAKNPFLSPIDGRPITSQEIANQEIARLQEMGRSELKEKLAKNLIRPEDLSPEQKEKVISSKPVERPTPGGQFRYNSDGTYTPK